MDIVQFILLVLVIQGIYHSVYLSLIHLKMPVKAENMIPCYQIHVTLIGSEMLYLCVCVF